MRCAMWVAGCMCALCPPSWLLLLPPPPLMLLHPGSPRWLQPERAENPCRCEAAWAGEGGGAGGQGQGGREAGSPPWGAWGQEVREVRGCQLTTFLFC